MNMRLYRMKRRRKGFTMIEMMVVIGIVVVLAFLANLIINPYQRFSEANDSQRLSEISTLVKAVEIVQADLGFLGNPNVVYVSEPAPCSDDLPELEDGWTYQCAPEATYQNADGTGWLPVNVSASMSVLATEKNSSDPESVYMYVTDGVDFIITTKLVSEKYTPKAASDGGSDPERYEVGSSFALLAETFAPTEPPGLIAHWKFDDGSGTTATDSSGNGITATGFGSIQWVPGKIGQAINFLSATVGFNVPLTKPQLIVPSNAFARTTAVWVKIPPSMSGTLSFLSQNDTDPQRLRHMDSCSFSGFAFGQDGGPYFGANDAAGNSFGLSAPSVVAAIKNNQWHHLACTIDKAGNVARHYLDGVEIRSRTVPQNMGTIYGDRTRLVSRGSSSLGVTVDDLRVYNRALTATEIVQLYNLGN